MRTAKLLLCCSYYNSIPLPFQLDKCLRRSPILNHLTPPPSPPCNSSRVEKNQRSRRRNLRSAPAVMLHQNPVVSDLCATGLSSAIALSVLRLWQETVKRRIFDQSNQSTAKISRVLHISPADLVSADCRHHITMFLGNPIVSDVIAAHVSVGIILLLLHLWKETAKHGLDQKLNRKLVHISIGLVFMLCWPLFSSGHRGAILAALTPGINIFRMLFLGLGIWKDEATVKSMSRFGDHRELLKGPLYYALTITLACAIYWRTSPIAIAAICNLCAGDGIADIVGRRFGSQKIPYNRDKSIAGSVAMVLAGFLASLMFMHYFASFGYVQESWEMALGFLVVSVASAVVESLPVSTKLDDNLTVSLASILLGSLVF